MLKRNYVKTLFRFHVQLQLTYSYAIFENIDSNIVLHYSNIKQTNEQTKPTLCHLYLKISTIWKTN